MIISFFPCIFLGPSDGPNAWSFHGEATNFRGEATNFRGAMSNFRGEATNFRGEATGGNQWPLHKWIYYRNEVKTHILVTHRRSQVTSPAEKLPICNFSRHISAKFCVEIYK